MPEEAAPWAIPCFQKPEPFAEPRDWLLARLALPGHEVRQELEGRDLPFLGVVDVHRRSGALAAAATLIDLVPSLARAIRKHVRGVSILQADEAYDVSHSEPRWPDWIFISCPSPESEVSALRAAENVIHEAMHLQLTKVEKQVPLIEDVALKMHSPWKEEPRDLQGILHGLYVSTCIRSFLSRDVVVAALRPEGLEHARKRTLEIPAEVQLIDLVQLSAGLTPAGRDFLARLQS